MKVLVACEFSGIVRDAFLEAGHDAISCDLLPTESPGPHIQGDVRPWLREPWDLVIAHPPCNHLTRARGKMAEWFLVEKAIEFFQECHAANAPRVAVENPIPFKAVSDILGPPQCKVDPYMFGDNYRKRTWWWTRGLPPLLPLMYSDHPDYLCPNNSSKSPGLAGRNSRLRARFHSGMADAMAQQWGCGKLAP